MQHSDTYTRSARLAVLRSYRDPSAEPACLRDDVRAARERRILEAQRRIKRGNSTREH